MLKLLVLFDKNYLYELEAPKTDCDISYPIRYHAKTLFLDSISGYGMSYKDFQFSVDCFDSRFERI